MAHLRHAGPRHAGALLKIRCDERTVVTKFATLYTVGQTAFMPEPPNGGSRGNERVGRAVTANAQARVSARRIINSRGAINRLR